MATVLGADMLTIREAPVFVAPGCEYGAGTGLPVKYQNNTMQMYIFQFGSIKHQAYLAIPPCFYSPKSMVILYA